MFLHVDHLHWTTETTNITIAVVDDVIFTRVSMETSNTGRTSEHLTLCALVNIFDRGYRGYLVTVPFNSLDSNSVQHFKTCVTRTLPGQYCEDLNPRLQTMK